MSGNMAGFPFRFTASVHTASSNYDDDDALSDYEKALRDLEEALSDFEEYLFVKDHNPLK